MSKLIKAEDILNDARGFLGCTWVAAANLGDPEETDAIQTITNAAARKIAEAIALLNEYRAEQGDLPPDAVAANHRIKPGGKRKGK